MNGTVFPLHRDLGPRRGFLLSGIEKGREIDTP
jgi:hypothetical protein